MISRLRRHRTEDLVDVTRRIISAAVAGGRVTTSFHLTADLTNRFDVIVLFAVRRLRVLGYDWAIGAIKKRYVEFDFEWIKNHVMTDLRLGVAKPFRCNLGVSPGVEENGG